VQKDYQEQETFAMETLHVDFGLSYESIHVQRVDQHHASLWTVAVRLDRDFIVAGYNMGKTIAVLVSRIGGKLGQANIGSIVDGNESS